MAHSWKRRVIGGDFRRLAAIAMALAIGFAADAVAQDRKRVPIPLQNSRVGFVGDDSFVTGRSTWQPQIRDHLWSERLNFVDGAIDYYELRPNYYYTEGGRYQESQAIVDDWKKQKAMVDKGLTITRDDVRDASNAGGTYFFVVKGNDKGSCGYARQVSGITAAAMHGNKRVNVMGCMTPSRGTAQDLEKFIVDVMTRIRLDEGEINKAKVAALSAVPPPSLPGSSAPAPNNRQSGTVTFTWEGVGTSSGSMEMENQAGRGALSVMLQGRSEPCRGFWTFTRGSYGTNQVPEGTWTLNCPGNISAGGNYTSTKPGQGIGAGNDNIGRKITFSYGG